MIGRNRTTMGRPNANHSVKLIGRSPNESRNSIAIWLAGVPIALPTPPIVAA